MRRRTPIFLVPLLAAVAFLLGVGRKDITTSHEARVAQTAREMADGGWPWSARTVSIRPLHLVRPQGMVRLEPREGERPIDVNPWLIPIYNGQVRLQKPPLPYWCAAVIFRLAGQTAWSARIVPAALGFFATFLMMDLARRLLGRRAAYVAGMLWVSSYFIPQEYRKAMADPYLAFFTLGCVWAWVKRSGDRGQGSGRYVLLFYASMLGGLMAKGPVILIHVAIGLAAYHLCYRRRPPRGAAMHLLGIALVLALGLPWPLYVLRHVPGAVELWRYESVGELADNVENAREWWFYFPDLLLLAVPWTPVWLAGLVWPGVRRRRRLWFPVAWYLATVCFFSLSNLKKDAYLLPVMPAMVLMVTQVLLGMIAAARRTRPSRWAEFLWRIQGVLVMVLAGVVVFLLILKGPDRSTLREFAKFFRNFHVNWSEVTAADVAAAVIAVVVAIAAIAAERSRRPRLRFGGLAAAFALLFALFFQQYMTVKDNGNSLRPFAQAMLAESSPPGCTLFQSNLPDPVRFYLPRNLTFDPTAQCAIVAVENRRRKGKEPTQSPFPPIFEGRITSTENLTSTDPASGNDWTLYRLHLKKTSHE